MTVLRRISPVLFLLGAMWALELLDLILGGRLNQFGVRSWNPVGLLGIFVSPLLHVHLGHLIANTGPMLILGAIIAWQSQRTFWWVTAFAAVTSGLGAWVVNAPGTVTIGASGLVFGYFAFLIARAFVPGPVPHRILYAAVALLVGLAYGGTMIGGLIPGFRGISWQAHLFGAVGGVLAALAMSRATTGDTAVDAPNRPTLGDRS